jgi:hypothetical protein
MEFKSRTKEAHSPKAGSAEWTHLTPSLQGSTPNRGLLIAPLITTRSGTRNTLGRAGDV